MENAYTHPSYSDLGVTPFVTPSSCPWAGLNTFIQGRHDFKKKIAFFSTLLQGVYLIFHDLFHSIITTNNLKGSY